MRRMNLTAVECKLIHTVLNSGDPQKGLSLSEVRTSIPILDKLEAPAIKKQTPEGESIEFVDASFKFKESEYNTIISKLENSSGWASVAFGRMVVKLIDTLKEVPLLPEQEKAS